MNRVESGNWATNLIKRNEELLEELAELRSELDRLRLIAEDLEKRYGKEES